MNDDIPKIAVTLGDPAGIGPEVIIKALRDPDLAAARMRALLAVGGVEG